MKTALKLLAALLAVALLAVIALGVHVWFFKPWSIDIFFEKVFLRAVVDDPETLSQLRILEPLGIDFHDDELTDASPSRQMQLSAQTREALETLHRYDRERLEPQQQLSYDILDWFLADAVAGEPWQFHDYPLNQMFGVQSDLPDFMVNTHQINDAETARDYVARLDRFRWKFGQVMEGLRLREARGIVPPRFTVEKVMAEMKAFVAPKPEEQLLYTHLRDALQQLKDVPQAERDAILADGGRAVAESVIPAYRQLISYYETLLPKATANHGVWALPQGDAFYAWCVRHHTTTDFTPEQVHQIGLAEVARIEAQVETILRGQGLTRGSVGVRMAELTRDARFLYPDSDDGRKQVLADFQHIIDEVNAGLDPYFNLRPASSVKVERIPQFKEKTAPGAYYQPPPLDRSRPGVFYTNLRDPRETYKWGMRTLAYHEAIPGHHFQIAIAQELQHVPTFRKLGLFTAYAEGWALYAERLASEAGFEKDPMDDLGRLQSEMFRAVRLVVDTGMHYRKWTREQAIEYMRDKVGQPEADVVAEIERYLVMPGQALAYKAGMMKILQLREKAQQALGERFQLKDFHDVVLRGGAMPLAVLEAQVDRYIAAQRAR
ncbi:MAG TPA: DUF885 domain-containing protein [Candidatus Binatia bacterium]|nr:DUF885 domain-containing protein [Candidatus Binatia bacterium]